MSEPTPKDGDSVPLAKNRGLSTGAIFQDRYEVVCELGQGSFSRVYKARQLCTGQHVALKILHRPSDESNGNRSRHIEDFRLETKLCADLSHPNIVRLIDSGETADGLAYAVFEFVPGTTLRNTLLREGKLGVADAVHLMAQVLDALSCAHTTGVVHRDLKPENIMVTKTGARRNALVLDFGLGGLVGKPGPDSSLNGTSPNELLGTVRYAAPEQLRGEPPSPRSDLYAWGMTLLECLTGDPPYHGASTREVILKQLGSGPAAVPGWLRNHALGRVIEIVTAKQPEKRDVAIDHLLSMLSASIGESPALASRSSERERRQLTVVCCRLAIVTDEGNQIDVDEADQLLHAYHATLAERAARVGGCSVVILADRVLLTFGYPQAREGDARHAARLALDVASTIDFPTQGRLRIEVCIGVHTGLVTIRDSPPGSVVGTHQLTGLTSQIASQLAESADPGAVFVSFETQRLVRDEFDAVPVERSTISRLPSTQAVFRLRAPRRALDGDRTASAPDSPLVGRTPQLQRLLDGWARTGTGQSSIMVITGEPGIGKSRLLRELGQRVGPDAWVEMHCAPENQATPLRPVIDALLAMDQSVESLLTRYAFGLADNLPLFAALLARPLDDQYEPLHLSSERQKELTLQALVALVLRMALEHPIVLAIENLHWADPTTLELVTRLIQALREVRYTEIESRPKLYGVFTTRPEFIPAWSGDDVVLAPLQRLGQADAEDMVRAGFSPEHKLPPGLLEEVVQRAEGVPLFVEEITRVVRESARMEEAEADRSRTPERIEIPSTLRDLLTARLDGVSPAAHDTAQLAAVLGREFRYELLRAVSPKDAAFLRQDIAELGQAGLLVHRRSGSSEHYLFRHALLRDAAYETMTRSTRQGLHLRVAHTLQREFSEIEEQRPEILALHYEQGGAPLPAADYWRRAGDHALRQVAYIEAMSQLERGLGLLQQGLPESSVRTQTEIELLTTLGTAQFMTRGYAAAEVEQIFARAWELCERLGTDIPVKILHGIWAVEITRSNREAIDRLLPRIAALARHAEDPVSALSGHGMLGASAFWRGNFPEANEQLARGRRFYDTPEFERFKRDYGYDGGLDLYGLGMSTLWQLGYPDQAEALRLEMLAIAERSRNPYSLAIALAWASVLAHDRGDVGVTIESSQQLSALATEQQLFFFLAPATCALGGALLQQGDAEGAITIIQQGTALYQGLGVLSSYSYYLTYLATAHLAAQHTTEGLAVVDEAISYCDTLVAQFHRPELLRLKGELLVLQGDVTGADACLRRALSIAHDHQAKSYELRAAMSLGRLLREHDKRDEAQAVVGEVYEWFAEGFETRDLRQARAYLAESGVFDSTALQHPPD